MGEGFQRFYFDRVYNPVYDATTATLDRYRRLQHRCLVLLGLAGGERLLCLGLGTGNEIAAAAAAAAGLRITGVDLSPAAIARARVKARRAGVAADLRLMDARALAFADGAFDRVLCIHVLDFVDGIESVIGEALRVLRPGGRFVFTLPSRKEGPALGGSLFADQVRSSLQAGKSALAVAAEMLLLLPVGLLYAPLLFRKARGAYTRTQAAALFDGRPVGELAMEEEAAYQDLILAGTRA